LRCFDRALEIEPESAVAWTGKGCCLACAGQPVEAIECFDLALGIDPEYAEAWSCRGYTSSIAGQPLEALHCYDRALAINPRQAMARENKEELLARLSSTGRH
jgi:tetratricopeptide (TPR) repeat protein